MFFHDTLGFTKLGVGNALNSDGLNFRVASFRTNLGDLEVPTCFCRPQPQIDTSKWSEIDISLPVVRVNNICQEEKKALVICRLRNTHVCGEKSQRTMRPRLDGHAHANVNGVKVESLPCETSNVFDAIHIVYVVCVCL